MAALLAGARILLRQGLRCLPAHGVRPAAVPVRCLSSSPRFFATAVQDEDSINFEPLQTYSYFYPKGLALHNIREHVRRTGRVNKHQLLKVYEAICQEGVPSSNQAWFLLQACGSSMPEVPLAERTEIAERIWKTLQELGVVFNESHYNILLKIYLENEHKFSATQFLTDMEAAQVQPNQITYERLLTAYCNEGDIQGASTILGFLKSNNLPLTEEIFSSLIRGHARSGDMESAKNILSLMNGMGLEPGNETHAALLCAYAEKGDIETVKQTLNDFKDDIKNKMCLMVIYYLAKNGHSQFVPEILSNMDTCKEQNQDVINLCLSLLTQGYADIALQVAKKCFYVENPDDYMNQSGSFFIKHCVELNMPINTIKEYADILQESNVQRSPLPFVLRCALRNGKKDMALELLRTLKEKNLPVRPHYIWPLLTSYYHENHVEGSLKILKELQDVYGKLDLDTFINFIAPLFENEKYAESILQEIGFQKNFNALYLWALKEGMLIGRMKPVYFLLKTKIPWVMDKSVTPTFIKVFFRSLSYLQAQLCSFRADECKVSKFYDKMLKSSLCHCSSQTRPNLRDPTHHITKLLYSDDSSLQELPRKTESVGYFLYGLIDSMSDSEIRAKEEYLKQYFHKLIEMGVTLDARNATRIKQLLESHGYPEFFEEIKKLLHVDAKFHKAEDLCKLEEQLEIERANNLPMYSTLTTLINSLLKTEDVNKVLELTSKYGSLFKFSMYMKVLGFLCAQNKPEEALKLKEEINQRGFSEVSTSTKYLQFLKVLTLNGFVEDAINVLTEMQQKNVAIDNITDEMYPNLLDGIARKGDVAGVHRLFQHIMMCGLAKPTSRLCSPLVKVHLNRNDLSAAFDALVECEKDYGFCVMEDVLLVKLIEKGDTDLLKKTVDLLCSSKGERLMLHNLLFAFIETGKYEEARKIAETPGLRAFNQKINWHIKRYRKMNMGHVLEKSLEITQGLFGCDHKEMYYQLFCLYEQNNELDKVKLLWSKMQDDGLKLEERTRDLITKLLKTNKEVEKKIQPSERDYHKEMSSRVVELCEANIFNEAHTLFLKTKQDNIKLSKVAYARLIKEYLEAEQVENAEIVQTVAQSHYHGFTMSNISFNLHLAMQVRRNCLKDALVTLEKMVKDVVLPSRNMLNKLSTALAMNGDLDGLQKMEEMINNSSFNLSRISKQFFNCKIMAHFINGDSEEAMGLIETITTNKSWHSHSIYFLLTMLVENKMYENLEKVSIVIEKLANHFSIYHPVTDLFLIYFTSGNVEEAKRLLQRYPVIVENTGLLKLHITRYVSKNESDIYPLIDMLADFDPFYKTFGYRYLMRHYISSRSLNNAVDMLEKMKAEQIDPDEKCLQQLAALLREAGQPVLFPEPQASNDDLQNYEDSFSEEQSVPSSPSAEKL
ncbi:leucine-rich PPR motif-containing protein, mitochondrial [Mantella aurantiaca]